MDATQEKCREPSMGIYGALTLYGPGIPAQVQHHTPGTPIRTDPQHHIPQHITAKGFSLSSTAFIRHYSRHRNLLSLPPPTKMFQFGGFPLPITGSSTTPKGWLGSPIRQSQDPRMHAPPLGLSQLATAFISDSSQAIPQTA